MPKPAEANPHNKLFRLVNIILCWTKPQATYSTTCNFNKIFIEVINPNMSEREILKGLSLIFFNNQLKRNYKFISIEIISHI